MRSGPWILMVLIVWVPSVAWAQAAIGLGGGSVVSVPLDELAWDAVARPGIPPSMVFTDTRAAGRQVTGVSAVDGDQSVACAGTQNAAGGFAISSTGQATAACAQLFVLDGDRFVDVTVRLATGKEDVLRLALRPDYPVRGPREVPMCRQPDLAAGVRPKACAFGAPPGGQHGYVDISTELATTAPLLWTHTAPGAPAVQQVLTRDARGWHKWSVSWGAPAVGGLVPADAYVVDAYGPMLVGTPARTVLLVPTGGLLEQALADAKEVRVATGAGQIAVVPKRQAGSKPPVVPPAGVTPLPGHGFRLAAGGGGPVTLPLSTADLTRGFIEVTGAAGIKAGSTACGAKSGTSWRIRLADDACTAALRKGEQSAVNLTISFAGGTRVVNLTTRPVQTTAGVRTCLAGQDDGPCAGVPGGMVAVGAEPGVRPLIGDKVSVFSPTQGWQPATVLDVVDNSYRLDTTSPGGITLNTIDDVVLVRITRGGSEVQVAAKRPKATRPPPTGWCTEERFEHHVGGMAQDADYVLCVDLLNGMPGGMELFRRAWLGGDPTEDRKNGTVVAPGQRGHRRWRRIHGHYPTTLPREHGWYLEPGRDMVVLVRHEGAVTLARAANNAYDFADDALYSALSEEGKAESPSSVAAEEALEKRTVSVFHVAPYKAGSFDLTLTFYRPKIEGESKPSSHTVTLPFLVLRRYSGAFRAGVGMSYRGHRRWATSTATGQTVLTQLDGHWAGPEFVLGYAWYGPDGRVVDPRTGGCPAAPGKGRGSQFACRVHPYLGLAVLGPGSVVSDDGKITQRLALFTSTTLGFELEAGPSTSLAIGANFRRVKRPLPGFAEGSVVTSVDDVTQETVSPGISIILSVSPKFFKTSGVNLLGAN